jgi:hypothetical protein
MGSEWMWCADTSLFGVRAESQINFIGKHPEYPDAPILLPGRDCQPFGGLSINRKVVHEYLQEMYREVMVDYDCFW